MTPYQHFIQQLDANSLWQLSTGEMGISCQESRYVLAAEGTKPPPPTQSLTETAHIRQWLLEQENAVQAALFSDLPLCRGEFDFQARKLLTEFGAEHFYRSDDSSWALMIDDWKLIAVPPSDVRSRYGYYCEGDETLDGKSASVRVWQWLDSGEAFEDYSAKTHCRYFCRD